MSSAGGNAENGEQIKECSTGSPAGANQQRENSQTGCSRDSPSGRTDTGAFSAINLLIHHAIDRLLASLASERCIGRPVGTSTKHAILQPVYDS